MKYNFDESVNRYGTNSYKWDQLEKLFGSGDVLPMWVADMDFKSPPAVVEALKQRADHGVYGYTIRPQSYYDAIIGWARRRHQWEIKQEWISTSPGIVTALSILVSALTQPGDKIVIQSPVYPPFFDVVIRNDRNLIENHLVLDNGKYYIDFIQLEEQLKTGIKLMLLCSPHNPVGRVWSREELQKIGQLCLQYGVLVVSDEIHGDLIFKGHKHIPFAALSGDFADNSIICMAPSKTFNLAGLQTSTIIIPNPKLRKIYRDRLTALSLQLESYFGVTAVEAAYNMGEEWLEELLEYLHENLGFANDYFSRLIPQIKVIQPEGTYLVWLDCRQLGMDAKQLKSFTEKEAKLGLNQGISFGSRGEGFLRLNIACPREMLKEGLERLRIAIDQLNLD